MLIITLVTAHLAKKKNKEKNEYIIIITIHNFFFCYLSYFLSRNTSLIREYSLITEKKYFLHWRRAYFATTLLTRAQCRCRWPYLLPDVFTQGVAHVHFSMSWYNYYSALDDATIDSLAKLNMVLLFIQLKRLKTYTISKKNCANVIIYSIQSPYPMAK